MATPAEHLDTMRAALADDAPGRLWSGMTSAERWALLYLAHLPPTLERRGWLELDRLDRDQVRRALWRIGQVVQARHRMDS